MFTQEFEKQATRLEATLMGAAPLPFPVLGSVLSGAVSEEGKGIQTATGSFLGKFLGGITGATVGRGSRGALPLALLGVVGGGGLGSYLAHGPDTREER